MRKGGGKASDPKPTGRGFLFSLRALLTYGKAKPCIGANETKNIVSQRNLQGEGGRVIRTPDGSGGSKVQSFHMKCVYSECTIGHIHHPPALSHFLTEKNLYLHFKDMKTSPALLCLFIALYKVTDLMSGKIKFGPQTWLHYALTRVFLCSMDTFSPSSTPLHLNIHSWSHSSWNKVASVFH